MKQVLVLTTLLHPVLGTPTFMPITAINRPPKKKKPGVKKG